MLKNIYDLLIQHDENFTSKYDITLEHDKFLSVDLIRVMRKQPPVERRYTYSTDLYVEYNTRNITCFDITVIDHLLFKQVYVHAGSLNLNDEFRSRYGIKKKPYTQNVLVNVDISDIKKYIMNTDFELVNNSKTKYNAFNDMHCPGCTCKNRNNFNNYNN